MLTCIAHWWHGSHHFQTVESPLHDAAGAERNANTGMDVLNAGLLG